ncbi:MAG: CHAT domain-containing protein [Bacteroidota bacterium]
MNRMVLFILLAICCNPCFSQIDESKTKLQIADSLESLFQFSEALQIREDIQKNVSPPLKEIDLYNQYKIELNKSFIETSDSISLVYANLAKDALSKLKTIEKSEQALLLEHLSKKQYDNYLDEEALSTALETLEIFRDLGNIEKQSETLSFIVSQLDYLGQYQRALDYLNTSILLGQKNEFSNERLAKLLITKASVLSRINDLNGQISALKEAEILLENQKLESKFTQFDLYYTLTLSYYFYGDMENAFEYLDKLEAFYKANKNDKTFINHKESPEQNLNVPLTYKTTASIVLAKYHGYTEKISSETSKFINSLPKDISKLSHYDLENINDIYIQNAIYYTQNKPDYKKAIPFFKKAIRLNQANSFNNGLINLFYHEGFVESEFKNWEKAQIAFEKAISYPESKQFYAYSSLRQNLGNAYAENSNFEQAESLFRQTLDSYDDNTNGNFYYENVRDLVQIGQVFYNAFISTDEKKYLDLAYNAYRKSALVFSKIYRGDMFNAILYTYSNKIKNGLLKCAILLPEKEIEALELIEDNDSDYLWSKFLNNQSNTNFEEPKKLSDSLNVIASNTTLLRAQLSTLKDKNSISELEAKVDSLEKINDDIENILKQKYPSFNAFSKSDFALELLQNTINPDEVILKYIILDSVGYAYKIEADAVKLFKLDVQQENLKSQLKTFIEDARTPSKNQFNQDTYLASNLIEPILDSDDENKHLTIISNDYLSGLPFETLTYKEQPVIMNFNVGYSNSLKLKYIQESLTSSTINAFVAFAPQYKDVLTSKENQIALRSNRAGNVALLGALDESEKVTELFAGDLFKGNNATKANFIKSLEDYSIYHLAMHGIIDDSEKNESRLAFSNGESLTLSEFYQLRIPAELAVLSACNTGTGKLISGEGINNLSRAFTYSGVKSTVYSLWEVPDKETSTIMIAFYKNLKAGQSKDEALANAKRAFINENPAKAKPFYWAGFVINGDVGAISASSSSYWIYVIIASISILVLISVLVYKNKKAS